MITQSIASDGRIFTKSDTYIIRDIESGKMYEEAVDYAAKQYVETGILLPEPDFTDEQALDFLMRGGQR